MKAFKKVRIYIHDMLFLVTDGMFDIGEMVQATVDLVGTPPFDFEWQRSETIWDSNKKRYFKGDVLERHTVHNVEDHHYAINTSVEGVIEVSKQRTTESMYVLFNIESYIGGEIEGSLLPISTTAFVKF